MSVISKCIQNIDDVILLYSSNYKVVGAIQRTSKLLRSSTSSSLA